MAEELKPFQKVLVRDKDTHAWKPNIFAGLISQDRQGRTWYSCLSTTYLQCIPYEGNEYLLGTTDSPKQEFKWGDHVEVRRSKESAWAKAIYLAKSESGSCYLAISESERNASLYRYCRHANW